MVPMQRLPVHSLLSIVCSHMLLVHRSARCHYYFSFGFPRYLPFLHVSLVYHESPCVAYPLTPVLDKRILPREVRLSIYEFTSVQLHSRDISKECLADSGLKGFGVSTLTNNLRNYTLQVSHIAHSRQRTIGNQSVCKEDVKGRPQKRLRSIH